MTREENASPSASSQSRGNDGKTAAATTVVINKQENTARHLYNTWRPLGRLSTDFPPLWTVDLFIS